MGFLLLQSRPGGEYLKALSWPANFCGGFGIERQRERKFFVYQNRLDLASLNYFIAHLHWGFGAIAFMICASWLAHMIFSCLNPVADGCGHNWPPCTGPFFFLEGGSCVNLVWEGRPQICCSWGMEGGGRVEGVGKGKGWEGSEDNLHISNGGR